MSIRPFHLLFTSLLATITFPVLAASVSIDVLSATVKDQRITDAEVLLQRNGAQTLTGRTDQAGKVQFNSAFNDDQESLLIIKKSGYSNLVVKCPCAGMSYAISPVMNSLDGIRVVLSWGRSPMDLDSHFAFGRDHVYFNQRYGSDSNLDVDDTDGFGPETITLEKKHLGESYVYAVHDFSNINQPQSTGLSNSQAKVFVYIGSSLVRTYYVPRNQVGNLWTVFRITANGEFQDINTVQGIKEEAVQVENYLRPYKDESRAVATIDINSEAVSHSRALNQQGETAYREQNYDSAIALFQRAVEVNPDNGQAYSNLGLTFQKAGRVAEAIWANRKAIALANGSSANVIRASSYYNIGRIYEAAGQFAEAKQNYEWARVQKANPVYDTAIKRVSP